MDNTNVKYQNFELSYTSDIPNELQNKIKAVIQNNNSSNELNSNFINISEFTIETYDIFSGKALRALEVEVKSSMSLTITVKNKTSKKKLMAMKRYNANELNILAEKEMLDFIKNGIFEDFVDQIVLEVNLIEM
tara:strand:+ start:788 stop:1189 length:402 start_codon:yes stop_codon:yes gene_type:complete